MGENSETRSLFRACESRVTNAYLGETHNARADGKSGRREGASGAENKKWRRHGKRATRQGRQDRMGVLLKKQLQKKQCFL